MRPARFAAQGALWAACLVGINLAIGAASRSSVPRRLARAIEAAPGMTDLFVGNSLMEAGADAAAFERARPGSRALNIGLGSTSPVEHDILLRIAARPGLERVYYGAFDMQMTDPAGGGWGDLVGNRALVYYLDLDAAIRFYAPEDPIRAAWMRAVARVPAAVERHAIWARVERLRRRLGAIGLGRERSSRFGRAHDFRLLEAPDEAGFRGACRAAVDRRAGLSPAVADMLRLLRGRGVSPVVVEMPMPADHRRRFYESPEWARYRRHVEGEVRRAGGSYLVASDWVDDPGFADRLHLNDRGAAEFSRRLARAAGDGGPR